MLKRQDSKMAAPEQPAAEPAPEGEPTPEEKPEPQLPPPCMDLTGFPLKIDVFDAMHMLDEKQEKIEGAPNFRQVSGFPIFATGQPTEEGFLKVLDKTKVGAPSIFSCFSSSMCIASNTSIFNGKPV